jgi:hypothetical protein
LEALDTFLFFGLFFSSSAELLRSTESAEHDADYRELGRFPSREKAAEFLASVDTG